MTPRRIPRSELDELRAAVSMLRRELDAQSGKGEPGEARESPDDASRTGWLDALGDELRSRASDVDWMELFYELRRRMAVVGIEEASTDVDDFGLDAHYLKRRQRLFDFLFDRWWRIETAGTEGIPDGERILFVANRAGILPYDGLMIAHAVERARGPARRPRFLVADWLLQLPFWQPLLARIGGVRACSENVERLLRTNRWVVSFPEGQQGALKPFRDRYQLQRFARGGFVSIAVRERATIVPVAVVGSEEVHPILFQSDFAERVLGAPVPVTPTFPLLGPLGLVPLPSRWRIRFGEPLRFDDVPLESAEDPLYVNRTRELVRSSVQTLVDREVRGRSSAF